MPESRSLTESLYLLLGQRIRRRREELELTQADLAKAAGVSRSSFANVEAGRQYAPVHVLLGIADRLGTSLQNLIPTHDELEAVRASQMTHGLVLREGDVAPVTQKALLGVLDIVREKAAAKKATERRTTPRGKRK